MLPPVANENVGNVVVVLTGPPNREVLVVDPPKRVGGFAPPAVATLEKLKSEPV